MANPEKTRFSDARQKYVKHIYTIILTFDILTGMNIGHFLAISVADPGYLSRIRIFPFRISDPGSKRIPDLGSRVKKNPGSVSASKNLSILTK